MKEENITFLSSLKSVLQTAGVISRMDWKNLPAFITNKFIATLQPFALLFFSARILDGLVNGMNEELLLKWIIMAVGCNYVLYLLERLTACIHSVEGVTLYWRLYKEMSRTMMKADYVELESAGIRQAKERIEQSSNVYWYGPWEVPGVMMNVVEGVTITVSSLLLAFPIFLSFRGWGSILGIMGMTVLVVYSVWYSLTSEKKIYKMKEDGLEALAAEYRRSDFLRDYAGENKAAKDIRLYRQQGIIREQYERCGKKIRILNKKRSIPQAKSFGIRSALAQAVSCLAYVIVGIQAFMGFFTVGSVVQYVGAITKLSEGIRLLVYSVQHIKMQGPHCQEYLDFIGMGSQGNIYERDKKGTESIDKAKGYTIDFEHVSFRYPGAEEWALKDITLQLKSGKHLAVVGMNGSGKTTFIKLLCRLYEPTEGRILLNGMEISKYKYEEYQKLFGVVFQDFQLFALPLGENVAADVIYDKDVVWECLNKAGSKNWAEKLPQKLAQPLYTVERDGVNISGGEAQKLAIARALYKDAPIVVLDEPTAALDPMAEAEIYSRFNELVEEKGAVYISHRLSSCRFCDTIAVFDKGILVEEGDHETLLKNENGKYRELWQAQAQYYT